ncbi:MAG TPA: hypothetical protein V6D26_30700 [Stenomitos sp.]
MVCPNGSEKKPDKSNIVEWFAPTKEALEQLLGLDPAIADALLPDNLPKIPVNPPLFCLQDRPIFPDLGDQLWNPIANAAKLLLIVNWMAWNEYCQCKVSPSIPPPPGSPNLNCSGKSGWQHGYNYSGAPFAGYFELNDNNSSSVWTAVAAPGGSGCGLSVRKDGAEQFFADGGCGSTRITSIVFGFCPARYEPPPPEEDKLPPDDVVPDDTPPDPPIDDLPPPESDPPTPPGESEPGGCEKCCGRLDWEDAPPIEDGAQYFFSKTVCRAWIAATAVPTWDGTWRGRGEYPDRALQWGEYCWIVKGGRTELQPLKYYTQTVFAPPGGAEGIAIYLKGGYACRVRIGSAREEE